MSTGGLTWLAVAAGAAVGAPSRYLFDQAVQLRLQARAQARAASHPVPAEHPATVRFPVGILLVNLLGSLVLGGLVGFGRTGPMVIAVLGTGWCGAFTTYSTFGYHTVQLARVGRPWSAATNVVLSVVGGLVVAVIGYLAGRWLAG